MPSMQHNSRRQSLATISLCMFVLLALLIPTAIANDEAPSTGSSDEPCAGGTCPTPSDESGGSSSDSDYSCGYWMGPSPIKEHEKHGFGLGLFTGKAIKEGTVVDGESVFIPIYDWDDDEHPPFREYVWDGECLNVLTLTSYNGMFLYMPGVAAFAPCTSQNFNLQFVRDFEEGTDIYNQADESYPQKAALPPTAGSFSPYTSKMYKAVRDIAPGEELTAECNDDDFDGGTYFLSRYKPNNEDIMCLDGNVQVGVSNIPHAGKGLFAKQAVSKDAAIISSPLIAINRKDMVMPNEQKSRIPKDQLLLNYCLGHPNSELLFLPTGPFVNYLNHGVGDAEINAKIVWHKPKHDHDELHHRQQYHHDDELFAMSAKEVSEAHGRSLIMDIVATKDVHEGDEILIDYGSDWNAAWAAHEKAWNNRPPSDGVHVVSAHQYQEEHDNMETIRTVSEQMFDPYPTNVMFVCGFSDSFVDPNPDEENSFETSWLEWEDYNCRLPCIIEGRSSKDISWADSDADGDGNPVTETVEVYTALLIAADFNPDVEYNCKIVPGIEYTIRDIPRYAIEVTDRPYSSHTFIPQAFRHAIGVPDDFYPANWVERNVRRRSASSMSSPKSSSRDSPTDLEVFKRKETRKKLENKLS